MSHGKTIRPEKANSSQLFSQRHAAILFIGAAKLPLRMPASVTTAIPHTNVWFIPYQKVKACRMNHAGPARQAGRLRPLRPDRVALGMLFGLECASCCGSGYKNLKTWEADASVMKAPKCARRWRLRAIASGFAGIAATLLVLTCPGFENNSATIASADQSSIANAGYVGAEVCSQCHPSIYESFLRTDMGRSMSQITPELLQRIP